MLQPTVTNAKKKKKKKSKLPDVKFNDCKCEY